MGKPLGRIDTTGQMKYCCHWARRYALETRLNARWRRHQARRPRCSTHQPAPIAIPARRQRLSGRDDGPESARRLVRLAWRSRGFSIGSIHTTVRYATECAERTLWHRDTVGGVGTGRLPPAATSSPISQRGAHGQSVPGG
eukprot:6188351-Pleurochrysis_carterae.AAC.3